MALSIHGAKGGWTMTASLRRTLTVALLCVVVAVTAFGRAPAAQQPGPSSNDTISALLQEVDGLRMAMEHSAAIAPQVQLTLGRLNIEEQRIAQPGGAVRPRAPGAYQSLVDCGQDDAGSVTSRLAASRLAARTDA
jgi:hypothetical protein